MTRNYKFESHHSGKLIFTSVVAATLGLIIMSPDMVKADTLTNSVAAKKQVNKNSSLSNSNRTTASVTSPDTDNNTTPEPSDNNVTQPETSLTSKTQASKDLSTANAEAKGITPRSVLTASWSGLKVTLDTATGILTIPGGTATNPPSIQSVFGTYRSRSIKKVEITGPLKLVGDARSIFEYLNDLTEIEGLNQVDTSAVTNMSFMFYGCGGLEHLDLSSFNTAKVTTMMMMLTNCSKLSSIDLHNFDTSNVTDMSYMFSGWRSLEHLDLSSFNTTKVTNMSMMFTNCSKLSSIDLHNFDTSNVTDMSYMFSDCSKLSSIDLHNFDTSNVTNMSYMFKGCISLKTLNISNFQMSQVAGIDRSGMLSVLPNLSTLVLGPKNYLQRTDLDTTGVWLNVGNGTVDKPQGNKRWTSSQLMDNYSGNGDQDTYVRLGGAVTVHYLDEAGKKLVEDKILNGKIGDSYSSEPQDIAGYVLKTTPANAKGTYTDKVQEVTYVYTNQVKVLAHYVDQDGKPIADDETISGKIGDPYPDSAVKDIQGYTLKTKPAGKFSGTETEVTYVYAKNVPVNTGGAAGRQPIVGGSVTVHYQDETGKQLAPDQILTGNVGEGYLTQEVALAGYKLTQRPANATGFYTANPQSVTYIYSQNVTGQAAVRRTVFHNSYLYDQNGGRKTGKYLMGKTIWTYGTKVIQGKKYYDLGQDNYVKATNVSGVKRKLRRNSYIYNKAAKKLQRKALKKGQKVRTYGAAVKIHRKLYYIVGKNQYVKKSNF